MNSIPTSEKVSSWERIKQAIIQASEQKSNKPLEEKLKEEALVPLYLYKGAVKGALKMLESGIAFNGLKDSIKGLHQLTTDQKGFAEEEKQRREIVAQFGKEVSQDPKRKFWELVDGAKKLGTQKIIDFIQSSRIKQAETIGELAPDVALSAMGVEEVVTAARAERLFFGLQKVEKGAISKIPLAFSKPKEFAKFTQTLKVGLEDAGFQDAQMLFRGSSVTGKSFRTGEAFSLERGSDLDVALAGRDIFEKAKLLKIPLVKRGGIRTWPLTNRQIERLGLGKMMQDLKVQTPYPVTLMIYDSVESVTSRGPHILVP